MSSVEHHGTKKLHADFACIGTMPIDHPCSLYIDDDENKILRIPNQDMHKHHQVRLNRMLTKIAAFPRKFQSHIEQTRYMASQQVSHSTATQLAPREEQKSVDKRCSSDNRLPAVVHKRRADQQVNPTSSILIKGFNSPRIGRQNLLLQKRELQQGIDCTTGYCSPVQCKSDALSGSQHVPPNMTNSETAAKFSGLSNTLKLQCEPVTVPPNNRCDSSTSLTKCENGSHSSVGGEMNCQADHKLATSPTPANAHKHCDEEQRPLGSSDAYEFTHQQHYTLNKPRPSLMLNTDNTNRLDDFEIISAIGKGCFSTVYKAHRKLNKEQVALKIISLSGLTSEKARVKCLREIQLLQSVDHPSIIKYHESFIQGPNLCIVLEWAGAGDLKCMLLQVRNKGARLHERVIWTYFVQICHALKHMHERRMIHRDVKPANVFMLPCGRVKLGDLGLGRSLSDSTLKAYSKVGTPLYMSPEVLQGSGQDFKSDIWSLGCVLYEMAMLRSPFEGSGSTLQQLFQNIMHASFPQIPVVFSTQLRSLVHEMLNVVVDHRPHITNVTRSADLIHQAITQNLDQGQRESNQENGTKPDSARSMESLSSNMSQMDIDNTTPRDNLTEHNFLCRTFPENGLQFESRNHDTCRTLAPVREAMTPSGKTSPNSLKQTRMSETFGEASSPLYNPLPTTRTRCNGGLDVESSLHREPNVSCPETDSLTESIDDDDIPAEVMFAARAIEPRRVLNFSPVTTTGIQVDPSKEHETGPNVKCPNLVSLNQSSGKRRRTVCSPAGNTQPERKKVTAGVGTDNNNSNSWEVGSLWDKQIKFASHQERRPLPKRGKATQVILPKLRSKRLNGSNYS